MSRTLLVSTGAVGCVIVAVAASFAFGAQQLSLAEVGNAMRTPAQDPTVTAVVLGLRLPRTVLGVTVGAALGLAGALAQVHTRNPLADPGLLGVTSGASFAVIAGLAFFGFTSPAQYVWCALAGATLSGAVVLVVAARVRALSPLTTLVLTGAVFSALLGAGTTAIVLTHEPVMRAFQGWSIGSLVGRPLDVLTLVAPMLAAGFALTLMNLPAWPGLELGDRLAAGLGRHPGRDRIVGAAAIVALTAGATAIAGPVAFVGLLAPHLARRLVPGAPVACVLLAAPLGSALLVGADVLGRIALPTGELPVGIAIAIIGAPVFFGIARAVAE